MNFHDGTLSISNSYSQKVEEILENPGKYFTKFKDEIVVKILLSDDPLLIYSKPQLFIGNRFYRFWYWGIL